MVDDEGKTAMYYAIVMGHTQIVGFLLERGANCNSRTTFVDY